MTQAKHSKGLYQFLIPYASSLVVATVMVVILGAVSATLFALVGPTFYLMTQKADVVSFNSLFGPHLGDAASRLWGSDTLPRAIFIDLVPKLVLGLATVRLVLSTWQWAIWEKTSELMARDIRSEIFNRYLARKPSSKPSACRPVDENFSSVLTTDVRYFREFVIHFWGGFPRECFIVFSTLVVLVILSPKLSAAFFLIILPAGALIARLGKSIKKRRTKAMEQYSLLTEWLQQRLLGIETIKHLQTETIEAENMASLNNVLFEKFVRTSRAKAKTAPLLELIGSVAMVGVLFLALRAVHNGDTPGSVQLSFFANVGLLLQSCAKLARYYNANKEGKVSQARIDDLLNRLRVLGGDEAARESNMKAVSTDGNVALEIDHIEVRYEGNIAPVLSNFSFKFKRGTIYAIMGKSGAGKSTLFSAILDLVQIDKGKIAKGTSRDIGYMPQHPPLISGSIAENIAYPETNIDSEKVKRVALDLRFESSNLPKDLFSLQVGPGGMDLSGGQTQKIHFARLLYHDYDVILIDEGTSALDPESEREISEFIRNLKARGACILMIAHRLAVARMADEILILEKGDLKFSGSSRTVNDAFLHEAISADALSQ
ncbi:MAG: ATP-binding cassette domain-containing protein [Oligoflexales bacterium]